MDLLSKVIIGIILFIVTSAIAYLFKIRQLYATSLNLYSKSILADNGSICEIHIYNRGKKVEENIKLELNPRTKCSLLASNVSDITMSQNNTIQLDRLHSGAKASIMLLIDEGELNVADMTSLSSKECVGKVLPNIFNIPSNYGTTAIVFASFFLGLPALIYFTPIALNKTYHLYTEYKYTEILNKGWEGIGEYLISDLSDSYSKQEFPIRLLNKVDNNQSITLSFEIINKSAIPLKLTLMDGAIRKEGDKYNTKFDFYKNITIEPLHSKKVDFNLAKRKDMFITFTLESGSEHIYDIQHSF